MTIVVDQWDVKQQNKHTIKSVFPLYTLKGQDYDFQKIRKYCIFSPKIDFVIANSADPDEIRHYAAFNLGLHCLPKYPFWLKVSFSDHRMSSVSPSVHFHMYNLGGGGGGGESSCQKLLGQF